MVEADIKKLAQPDFTASARAGTVSIIITSEDQIPEAFWVPQPSKLDRQALLSALKNGQLINGAELKNPEPT
ncbi:MAG: siphovirus Gp157 family protein, partial [Hyphomicrobiales bacterium]|nr:siphovirus Gp157 family protein [Hyphomicrobiales bacterium]